MDSWQQVRTRKERLIKTKPVGRWRDESVQNRNEEAFEVAAALGIQSVLQGDVVLLQVHVLHRLQVQLLVRGENMLVLKHKSHATVSSVLRLRPSFSWPRPLSSGPAPWHSVSSALVDNDTRLLCLGHQAHLVLVSSSAHSSWFPLWSSVPAGSSLSNKKPDFLLVYFHSFEYLLIFFLNSIPPAVHFTGFTH